MKDGAFTSAGRELREQVETHTDGQMRGAIDAIGDGYSRLIDQLSAWSAAVRTLKGYPESGPHELAEAASKR